MFRFFFVQESPRKVAREAWRTGSWAGVCLCGFGLELGSGAGVRGLIFNAWVWVGDSGFECRFWTRVAEFNI